ncbi:transaldolase [Leifsonia sp. NPDC058230]|uniref:transaldolase n=1 Tax=Leifsonia sp. NPDC058230 TaxID=3346391 RepID=UPI0036DE8E73
MTATGDLRAAGVSIWLDDLSRDRIVSGGLERLIAERDVVGITTNPTIFAAAFTQGVGYRDRLAELRGSGAGAAEIAVALMTEDVQSACDILLPIHESTSGRDGRVSIEVSPAAAHDSAATLAEAIRLHELVDRPNVFVKIPATLAGVAAIEDAIAAGISINVTLIFGLDRYRQVIEAYERGLERARADGRDLSRIHSVASFFVSRVDVEVDRRLEAVGGRAAEVLSGKAAVANARLAYEIFEQSLRELRWLVLADAGANPQRPLWASTGVKDPRMRDTRYVEELVAPHTVNTMPEKTLEAVWDHGRIPADAIAGTEDDSRQVIEGLRAVGISMAEVAGTLEAAGIATFADSWERLLAAVAVTP